jgi:hypothetical protein
MKKSVLLLAAILSLATSVTRAQEDHAYTMGPVVIVNFVRTQPGMYEDYLRYLDTTYKSVMEEMKKQGIILDYAVYAHRPHDGQDADLILTVKYKNMAAFDDLQARSDPVIKQVFGSLSKAGAASADREKLRRDVGSMEIRQLMLK